MQIIIIITGSSKISDGPRHHSLCWGHDQQFLVTTDRHCHPWTSNSYPHFAQLNHKEMLGENFVSFQPVNYFVVLLEHLKLQSASAVSCSVPITHVAVVVVSFLYCCQHMALVVRPLLLALVWSPPSRTDTIHHFGYNSPGGGPGWGSDVGWTFYFTTSARFVDTPSTRAHSSVSLQVADRTTMPAIILNVIYYFNR